MDEWKREGYTTLRPEIADKIKLWNDLSLFDVAMSIAVHAFLSGSGSASWWEYLLPLYPFARIISCCRRAVGKLVSYIVVYVEEEVADEEVYRPQRETLDSRLQLDRPTVSEEFGARNRYYIRKGGELLMMSVVYLAIFLHHAHKRLIPLLQCPIGTDDVLHIVAIALATLFAFLVVASMAMVRPARMPMKEAREKRKTVWSQLRIGGLQASIEFDVVGAKREPKVTIEIVGNGGRRSRAFAWAAGN